MLRAQGLWFTPMFFGLGTMAVFLCALGFAFPVVFRLGQLGFALLMAFALADAFLLFRPSVRISAERKSPKIMGLGEETEISIFLRHSGPLPLWVEIIDELPEQLQKRDFSLRDKLDGQLRFDYTLRPIDRGVYSFGHLNVFAQGPLRLLRRRWRLPLAEDIPVYPNIAAMHRAELMAISRMSVQQGSKRLQRLGQSYEFEQISPFTEGDDYRNINWKATGKTRQVMTNKYRDERSQNLYCIISKGRSMKMAFDHMTYLDYAINATLAISNLALKKHDKAGLITFSNKIGSALRAENRPGQIRKIIDALYGERERSEEPDYALLHRSVTRLATTRSLILLFANFQSSHALDAALPTLRKINRKHVLVIALFEDAELSRSLNQQISEVDDIYRDTLTRAHLNAKRELAFRLKRNGIQTITCTPEQLSTDVINKYIELKSRGAI